MGDRRASERVARARPWGSGPGAASDRDGAGEGPLNERASAAREAPENVRIDEGGRGECGRGVGERGRTRGAEGRSRTEGGAEGADVEGGRGMSVNIGGVDAADVRPRRGRDRIGSERTSGGGNDRDGGHGERVGRGRTGGGEWRERGEGE